MNSQPEMNATSELQAASPFTFSAESGEETLRLIAGLPAPAGLEDRVKRALRQAPRRSRLLDWTAAFASKADSGWMRSLAAAAIVLAVLGGGWGIYLRVQPAQAPKSAAVPVRSGFSSAGAVRTPVTLPGPAAVPTAPTNASPASPAPAKTAIKVPVNPGQKSGETPQNK